MNFIRVFLPLVLVEVIGVMMLVEMGLVVCEVTLVMVVLGRPFMIVDFWVVLLTSEFLPLMLGEVGVLVKFCDG